jgi:hypothetical protein
MIPQGLQDSTNKQKYLVGLSQDVHEELVTEKVDDVATSKWTFSVCRKNTNFEIKCKSFMSLSNSVIILM